jgi:small subunit ribosomal protein S2
MKITLEKIIVSGIHLGHATRYINPKIATYVYGVKSRIHLIDLVKTCYRLEEAREFVRQIAATGKPVLFVGTKDQAAQAIEERAKSSKRFYVKERWLGGTFTNWSTIRISLLRLHSLERDRQIGVWIYLKKNEVALLQKRLARLERYLCGLKGIRYFPGVLIIVGQAVEISAIRECLKVKIPTVCSLDTDSDPSLVNVGIPMNDDSAIRIQLFLIFLVPRVIHGHLLYGTIVWSRSEVDSYFPTPLQSMDH